MKNGELKHLLELELKSLKSVRSPESENKLLNILQCTLEQKND